MDNPLVSVIIPTRKVTGYIRENIEHIVKGTYRNFEIIVVTDRKETVTAKNHVVCIESGPVGPALKRDMGAKCANGAILAFIDDDAYPTGEWLAEVVRAFGEKDVAAVGGPGMTPPGVDWREELSGWIIASPAGAGPYTYRFLPQKRRDIDDFPSMNLSVRAVDFRKAGGFDSHYYPGEDTKLCLDLVHKLHRRIVYVPNAIVYHHRRPLWYPHLLQHGNYGIHRGHFARILPETSSRPAYFAPSILVVYIASLMMYVSALSFRPSVYTPFALLPLGLYIGAISANALWILRMSGNIFLGIISIPAVIATHLWYGLRFIQGYFMTRTLDR
jgi:glycosyltransferase involved in cell wall biosynthesis